ncbi:MAG: Hpt domain-containing protein [Syntrophomonadaceae bacterium]|nr:Hpt domain-containing protein [Syntrophomonadaceae bacterium]
MSAREPTDTYYRLMAVAEGDVDFLLCLIKAFLGDVPRKLAALQGAISLGNWEEARVELANIKSSGELLGFSVMAEKCRQLEAELSSGALLLALLMEYQRIETELRVILERAGLAEARVSPVTEG